MISIHKGRIRRSVAAAHDRTGTGASLIDQIREGARTKGKRRKKLVERREKWEKYTVQVRARERDDTDEDTNWFVQLEYCWCAVVDELELRQPQRPHSWFIQVVFCVSVYAQLFIHGVGQYMGVRALGIPDTDVTPVWYGLLVEYDNNHTHH